MSQVIVTCKCYNTINGVTREWVASYLGSILPNYPHLGDDYISLSTDDVPLYHQFPRRVISKVDIISIRKADSEETVEFATPVQKVKTFEISGSKGDKYIVKQDGLNYSCTCIGYSFRQTCKHILSIQ